MAGNAARIRKLREEPLHAALILRDFRIDLAIGSLEIGVGHEGGAAMARPGHVDHVEIVQDDEAVQVDVYEIQAGRGAPVTQQPRLHVFQLQRHFQEGIVEEVDLADGQVVGGAPIGVHLLQDVRRQGPIHAPISWDLRVHERTAP